MTKVIIVWEKYYNTEERKMKIKLHENVFDCFKSSQVYIN